MPQRTGLAIGSLLALTLGSAGTLLAPAASATSPYTNAEFSPYRSISSSGCTLSAVDNAPSDAPIAADGASHSFDHSYTATATGTVDNTDVTTVKINHHAVGKLTSNGSNPGVVSMSYSGSATLSRTKTPSECNVSGYAETDLNADLTLTEPMWVDVSVVQQGLGYGDLEIEGTGSSDFYLDVEVYNAKTTGTRRAYVPAGTYHIYMEGDTDLNNANASMSGLMSAKFTPIGARTAGPAGTAKSYVGLASARSCATHTLATKVTTNKKRAKTIKKIVFTVNGHKVKTVRSHLRGKTIPLTLSDTKAANVKATVTTVTVKKKHHHKKKIHKTRTVTANYLACK